MGSAKLLGINLTRNFDRPYLAASFKDFWRRWHISLSSWFRDYVYFPLGGKRVSEVGANINLVIVFLLSGLWHGANWTFVIWGSLHALFLFAERVVPRWPKILTFPLTSLAWVFFRADSAGYGAAMITRLFMPSAWGIEALVAQFRNPAVQFNAIIIGGLIVFEHLHLSWQSLFFRAPGYLRWSLYYVGLALIATYGRFEGRQFVYFQF